MVDIIRMQNWWAHVENLEGQDFYFRNHSATPNKMEEQATVVVSRLTPRKEAFQRLS